MVDSPVRPTLHQADRHGHLEDCCRHPGRRGDRLRRPCSQRPRPVSESWFPPTSDIPSPTGQSRTETRKLQRAFHMDDSGRGGQQMPCGIAAHQPRIQCNLARGGNAIGVAATSQRAAPSVNMWQSIRSPDLCRSSPVRHICGTVSPGLLVRENSCAFTDGADHFLSRCILDEASAIAVWTGHLQISLSSGQLRHTPCPPMLERFHPAGDINQSGSSVRDSTSPTSVPAGPAAQRGLPRPTQRRLQERFS